MQLREREERRDPLAEPESLRKVRRDWRRGSLLESRRFERAVWFAFFACAGVFLAAAARLYFGK